MTSWQDITWASQTLSAHSNGAPECQRNLAPADEVLVLAQLCWEAGFGTFTNTSTPVEISFIVPLYPVNATTVSTKPIGFAVFPSNQIEDDIGFAIEIIGEGQLGQIGELNGVLVTSGSNKTLIEQGDAEIGLEPQENALVIAPFFGDRESGLVPQNQLFSGLSVIWAIMAALQFLIAWNKHRSIRNAKKEPAT